MIAISHHKFKSGHRLIVINIGRLGITFFNYWLGFSKRRLVGLAGMGLVIDLGFVKVNWRPRWKST